MSGCRCGAYPGTDRCAPADERDAGTVRIVSVSEQGWSMTYEVECTSCGRPFIVKQTDGPSLRWTWVPRGLKRRRGEVG